MHAAASRYTPVWLHAGPRYLVVHGRDLLGLQPRRRKGKPRKRKVSSPFLTPQGHLIPSLCLSLTVVYPLFDYLLSSLLPFSWSASLHSSFLCVRIAFNPFRSSIGTHSVSNSMS